MQVWVSAWGNRLMQLKDDEVISKKKLVWNFVTVEENFSQLKYLLLFE